MYTVYWIHDKSHHNFFSEGYIGITSKTPEKRFTEHKRYSKNPHMRNRCNMEGVIVESLHTNLSEQEAKQLENNYRPVNNIGWNINVGGDIPPSRKGKSHPTNLLKGENRTKNQKERAQKHSEYMRGRPSPKKGHRYTPPKICTECSKEFRSYEKRAKFCSRKCMGENMSKTCVGKLRGTYNAH